MGDKIIKQPKNIIIYTSGDFPYGMAGENFVRMLSLGLEYHNRNIKIVRLYGTMYSFKNDTNIKCSNLLFNKKVKNEVLKFFELFFIILVLPFSIIKNKLFHKTDTILLYGIEYFYFVLPFLIFTKFLRIKLFRLITDYYDTEIISPTWWKKPKSFFYNFQLKYFDKKLSGIVCLSFYMYEILKKYIKNEKKILVIPHFIDLDIISENQLSNKDSKIITIGFCGTLLEMNGVFDLIDAFKIVNQKNQNTKLLVIGKINEDIREKMRELIFGFEKQIFITGYLSKQKVLDNLSTCDILINPRKSGRWSDAGFPTKLGEYFALQKPVVATKVGDLINYFEDKKEVVFAEPDSPQSIAEKIEFLIEQPEISELIAKNGYLWAKNNLDYKKNSETLINFITI